MVSHGYGVSVRDDEKFWMVGNGELYTQPYRIIYLKLVKMLHFMLCLFTTIVFKKEKIYKCELSPGHSTAEAKQTSDLIPSPQQQCVCVCVHACVSGYMVSQE